MGVILDHLIKDHGATLEQAKMALKDWQIKPMMFNGAEVGEYMMNNNEIHFVINPDVRLKLGKRQLMKAFFTEVFSNYQFLVTKIFKNDKQKKLIEFFGFEQTHEDSQYEYFWLDKEGCKWLQ